ncbi:MAG: protein-disulfide reductase DsbD N-terminal domain-containing protein [Bryobacter sp.]|nr:protein-disulfide reductase DsbD N-terminal domain-containing protein [Bryobacter sp.]
MTSNNCWRRLLVSLALAPLLVAQPASVLTLNGPLRTAGKRGDAISVKIGLKLADGYHVNSNKPNEEYLIPLRLTWEKSALEPVETVFPKPVEERSDFSKMPVSVFTGTFAIEQKFRTAATAAPGMGMATGKLRYQACNRTMCLPPKTMDVKLAYDLR